MEISNFIDEMMYDRENGMTYNECMQKYRGRGISQRQCMFALSLCGKRLKTPSAADILNEYGGVEFIRNLKIRGFTQNEIAEYFGFSVSTLQLYLRCFGVTFQGLEVPTYTLTKQIVDECKVE